MGEYLAAPALLDEPAVQQSFLSYFNTIVVSPGDGACLSWSVMRALLLMPPCVNFALELSISPHKLRAGNAAHSRCLT